MRFLGIDYGTKRIGIAVSDEGGKLAFPAEVLENGESIFKLIGEIIKENDIGEIVIGESLDFAGQPNEVQSQVEAFAGELGKRFKIEVRKEKEFLTSVEARRYQEKNKTDASAAALILQRYLERKNLI